jgi:sn-glycerol 3-phosphate transport system ATP-binding protein
MGEIVLRNVRKSYGRQEVVHGVSLDVAAGEFIVILGPSGCGKSTLLRMVAGLEGITAGEIEIGGRVVNKLEPRERGCAMVFQNYALYPHMTVAENIGYSLKIAGLSRAARAEKVNAVAAALGLSEFLDRKPGQLSGGQRQRVAMGRAMIREPKVFLYDEPLSNLDARLRVAMRVEIRKLHRRLGTTTLFVTHDQVEAMTLADRIVVMNKGVVEQVGTPQEIYRRPATTYVAGFIGTPGLNLVPGVVDVLAGEVALEDGQRLAYDRSRWPDAADGPVTVGFRAEAVKVGETGLELSFDFAEEHGGTRQLHGTLAGAAVVVQVADDTHPNPGDVLSFAVEPGDVQLFDAASGARLAERVPSDQTQRARPVGPAAVKRAFAAANLLP